MLNTPSSRPRSKAIGQLGIIRKIVADRAGREWCLFLDRDGVLNRRIVGDYVRNWNQFEWLPEAIPALRVLRDWAPHMVIVTNQQGVGKGLMSAEDVAEIHQHVQQDLAVTGETIDDFQVCPHLQSVECACRKPRPGLVLDWLDRNPRCDGALSVMVGDSAGDLELALNVSAVTGGCASIRIGHDEFNGVSDAAFGSLWDFACAVRHARGEGVG